MVWSSHGGICPGGGRATRTPCGSARRCSSRRAPRRSSPTTSGFSGSSRRSGTWPRRTEERVLALWSGLGYYRRARMLHAAAKEVAAAHGGVVPSGLDDAPHAQGRRGLHGGAVASIAFGRRAAVVDGNVARVLARLFAIEDDVKTARGSARLWRLAEELVPDGDGDPGDWNQALMELGATVCVPRAPAVRGLPGDAPSAPGASRASPSACRESRRRRRRSRCERVALVLASDRAVLLARRRTRRALRRALGAPERRRRVSPSSRRSSAWTRGPCEHAGDVVHVLSHRRMRVEVARGPLGRRRRWPLPGPEYDAVECVALGRRRVSRAGDARAEGACGGRRGLLVIRSRSRMVRQWRLSLSLAPVLAGARDRADCARPPVRTPPAGGGPARVRAPRPRRRPGSGPSTDDPRSDGPGSAIPRRTRPRPSPRTRTR